MSIPENPAVCNKCGTTLPQNAKYCPNCGRKIGAKRRTRRGNGYGAVYKEGPSWVACVTIRREIVGNKIRYVRNKKRGFATKKEAMEYLPMLRAPKRPQTITLREVYDRWREQHALRVGVSIMRSYRSSFAHLAPVADMLITDIRASDLQACVDNCGRGKGTKKLIKTLASQLFSFAIDDNMISTNPAANLWTGSDPIGQRPPLTLDELRRVASSGLPYADYVTIMAYMGYRPSELSSLTKSSVQLIDGVRCIVGGIKTDAGKNRTVPIPAAVAPIVDHRLSVVGTDWLFPREKTNRRGEFVGYCQMTERYFRRSCWAHLAEELGIEGKTPYGCRHTFADGLRDASGSDKDKAGLIGHTSYETTIAYYQTESVHNQVRIMDQVAEALAGEA